jgi:transcriptional regulator with GAF, ATPase, and Fis domain
MSGTVQRAAEKALTERYEALLRVSQTLISIRSSEELFRVLACELRAVVNFYFLRVGIYDENTPEPRLTLYGDPGVPLQVPPLPKEATITWWVYQHQQPLIIPSLDAETRFPVVVDMLKNLGVRSVCALPLTAVHRRLGALTVGSTETNAYSREDLSFLGQVASQIAVAVDNACAYHEIAQARGELEKALGEIQRLKDRLQDENLVLREQIDQALMFEEIVGISPALHAVLSRVCTVAPTDSTVLITGETGTGKELVARAVHKRSQCCSRAFVSVNCAAVPRDLIASELFGHEKGAFTGATQRRLGRFELAEGGTIFLDEVGELPAETQIALLHVLQEHEFERVGGTGSIRSNVRVIAATNRDLQAAIVGSTFRSDLFYRFNVFPIEMPPLRKRQEDIPLLVEYFIDRYARKAGKSIRTVNKKSLELLQSYPWPGNIRELQNVIERSVIVCDTENFSVDESWLSRQPVATEPNKELGLFKRLPSEEKAIIEAALRETGGRVSGPSGAAAKLGIPGSTLDSKIRSLKINKNIFKTTDPSTDRM